PDRPAPLATRPSPVLAGSPRWTGPNQPVARPETEAPFQPDAPTKRRHVEVLEFLAKGETNKEIARHLNLTEATIKVYVRELMKHFSAKNRMQVALKASALVQAQAATPQPEDDPEQIAPRPAMSCR
ncbi:response regulator transcription factor, partial [Paracoccus liaowanqingii]